MIYSVPAEGGYVYLKASGGFPATGRYRAPVGRSVNGMFPPEAFAAPMPPGATEIGRGEEAKGIIVVNRGVLGEVPVPMTDGKRIALGALIGFLVGELGRRFLK